MEQYKINLLKLAAKHEFIYDVFWNEDLEFHINCNDIFTHAADAEDITSQEDVDMIEQAAKELLEIDPLANCWATVLFIARKRNIRPLTTWHHMFDKRMIDLFDACGPEREDRNLFSELKEGIDDLEKRRLKKDLDLYGKLE
jgi:hypothetical protein